MLSPASLRVCCLAVMAPALTKADRRAECLPVSLSDPFCESKTAPLYYRKDKHIEAHYPKVSSRFAYLLNNRRKAYLHKTWYRTHLKNNSPEFCCKSPPADLHNAEFKGEEWHGTSVTLAVADKVKLKYTMNKNNTSIKNMGLTRTNASLGLQSMKKVNRISQFSSQETGNPTTPEIGESSPDLPDSTNSELETNLRFTDVVQFQTEPSLLEDMSSSSGDQNMCTAIDISCSEKNVTLPVACASPAAEAASDNCSITLPSNNVDFVGVPQDLNINASVTLTDSDCLAQSSENSPERNSLLHHPSAEQNTSVHDSSSNSFISPITCTADSSEVVLSATDESSPVIPTSIDVAVSATDFEKSSLQTTPIEPHFKDLYFEHEDFESACHQQTMGVKCPPSVAQPSVDEPVKPNLRKSRASRKKVCCKNLLDSEILNERYIEGLQKSIAAVERSELRKRIRLNAFARREIGELVSSYQSKLGIPCQRPVKKSPKSVKDMVELKAELLQSEDVKSLSTSALVNLVRTLESSGSPGNLLPNQNISFSGVDALLTDLPVMAFAPEDVADVIHTSRELLSNIKKELKCGDPDLTESSDDSETELDNQDGESAHKMALWKFMKKRAALTCRSTWLIARIHELENQLRTASGALQKVSTSVGSICLEENLTTSESCTALSTAGSGDADLKQKVKGLLKPLNGYLDHSSLNGIAHIGQKSCSVNTLQLSDSVSEVSKAPQECSRTRALNVSSFQKRDVLVTTGLHLTNSKFSKYSSVSCHCSCREDILPCVLCMGRYHCVQTIDPDSMPLLDRISLLDPDFHPLLSFQKDVPVTLHYESVLKKNESQYQIVRPASPELSHKSIDIGTKPSQFSDARSRSRKLDRYARTLSQKYRNKHIRNTKHLRKHGLVFGKWRKYQNRNFHARDRFRRISIDSSGSSHDSPIPSPGSIFDEGYDNLRRRQDNQFDINDVIIPYSNKSARLVEFEFKDIIVPSFRIEQPPKENLLTESVQDELKEFVPIQENTFEEAYLARHDLLEVEEKKVNRRPDVANPGPNPKRSRREHRFDSRADSSGANTPDPIPFCDQDMFQEHNFVNVPTPPTFSPPPTPSSAIPVSDDSQQSLGTFLATRFDRKKLSNVKRPSEELPDTEEVAPYERRTFPLTDEQYEEIAIDPYGEDLELTVSGPSSPASPGSTTQSTSTIEDDITDPEWMVLRNNPMHEPGLKLKLAKR